MKLFSRRNLIVLLVLAAVVLGLYLWRRLGSGTVSAKVARVGRGEFLQTFRTNGVVEPVEFREIRAEYPTRVLEVRVEEGERVRGGQSLAALDDREQRAAVAQAKAELLEAEQALVKARAGTSVAQLDAQIAQAKADLELATSVLRRNESLLKQKALSQLEFEESVAAHTKASEQLAALEKQRQTEVQRLQSFAEEHAQARVEQARELLRNAKARLRAAQVPAPLAGTVLVKPPKPGTLISVGDLLAKVGNIVALRVRAFIDQPDFSSLQLGAPLEIRSSGFPGERWQGRVVSLSAELSTIGKRVVGEALCAVEEGQHRLPVNSNVDLTFTSYRLPEALLVPVDAVFQMDARSYVYVVESSRLRLREVQVGPSNVQFTVIRSGLRENETVLNDLNLRASEGLRIVPR